MCGQETAWPPRGWVTVTCWALDGPEISPGSDWAQILQSPSENSYHVRSLKILLSMLELGGFSTRDTFIADGSIDLVLNSFLDTVPVEGLKQRSDVVSFYVFFVCFVFSHFVSKYERL